MQPVWQSCCPYISIFALEKMKKAKDILDKKAFPGTPISEYLLQVKKQ